MKNIFTLSAFLLVCGIIQAQSFQNMKLMSRWDDESLPDALYGNTPFSYAGCYGYAANGREYAILGSSAFVHFIDITDPSSPVEIDRFAGGDVSVWREVTVYQNYCYAVTDATSEGMMIFDLSQLPDTVIKVSQSTQFFSSCHTLFCDEENGRIYFQGSNSADIVILDVATDPASPQLLAADQLEGGYVHDMFVKDNIGYACHGFQGLYIYDFTSPALPDLQASIVTNGYCHSDFITEDDNYLFVADEVPTGLPLLTMDLEDVENGGLELANSFRAPLITTPGETVTYHNPYVKGDFLYVSSYMDGLQVFDITNPLEPQQYAWYDTYINTTYNGYNGCWGAYPFLPSGNILASDIQNGLFVLQFDTTISAVSQPVVQDGLSVFPNPALNYIKLELEDEAIITNVTVYSLAGQALLSGNILNDKYLNISALQTGMYVIKVETADKIYTAKVFKKGE